MTEEKAKDLKATDQALSQAMKNPLAEIAKKSEVKSEVADAIAEDKTKKVAPNQISPQLDKFENSLISKKRFQD